MYLLGYLSSTNRLYLGDKDLNVVTYQLHLAVIEYQTAVMRGDFATADQLIPNIPKDQRARVAHFLEKQGFKEQALVITSDAEHKFELAMSLKVRNAAGEGGGELQPCTYTNTPPPRPFLETGGCARHCQGTRERPEMEAAGRGCDACLPV